VGLFAFGEGARNSAMAGWNSAGDGEALPKSEDSLKTSAGRLRMSWKIGAELNIDVFARIRDALAAVDVAVGCAEKWMW